MEFMLFPNPPQFVLPKIINARAENLCSYYQNFTTSNVFYIQKPQFIPYSSFLRFLFCKVYHSR
jgi:hypothetical protein